jgi:hypothetical protein
VLTDLEKVDVRRFAGYALVGDTAPDDYRDFAYHWVLPGVMQTLYHRLNSLSAPEEAVLREKYIAVLNQLEDAVVGSSENLDTDQASVWKRNKQEVEDRTALYNQKRREMCGFLGLRPGPHLGNGGLRMLRG